MPRIDAPLLRAAADVIHALNVRYGAAATGKPVFYLFHRRRQWNPAQDTWMGWERKRGKLHEFNRLLRGATDTSFMTDVPFHAAAPSDVRFVLTLDADTIMPFGVATELVGTLLHPLNRPRTDPQTGAIIDGYAILQPRVTPTLPTRRSSSWFQQWFSGHCGVDPYTFQVSDVYQDLFGRGSFTGKGMYEVDAFEAALRGRMPDDAILSHDLLEGSYARCGFVSDIELFEEFPPHTEVAAARSHRWARGDWQLLPWIFGRRGRHLSPVRAVEDARQPAPHAGGAEPFPAACDGVDRRRRRCAAFRRARHAHVAAADAARDRRPAAAATQHRPRQLVAHAARRCALRIRPHAVPGRDAAARFGPDARCDPAHAAVA